MEEANHIHDFIMFWSDTVYLMYYCNICNTKARRPKQFLMKPYGNEMEIYQINSKKN